MSVWWVEAANDDPELFKEYEDRYGSTLSEGNIGLKIGDYDGGAIIEGTPEEIIDFLRDCLALVEVPTSGMRFSSQ